MEKYLIEQPWKIVEEGFDKTKNRFSESIFSLGNGFMGLRGNFEENYSGDKMNGTYLAGVYYPDKTRVGWWKNGYPEYFAKVLNSTNWLGIEIKVDGDTLDLNDCEIKEFKRELDMKCGILYRTFIVVMPNKKEIKVNASRFVSMERNELGVISYEISILNGDGKVTVTPYLDGNVHNEDSNYDEYFWVHEGENSINDRSFVNLKTKKTEFYTNTGMSFHIYMDDSPLELPRENNQKGGFISQTVESEVKQNQSLKVVKYVSCVTSRDHEITDLTKVSNKNLEEAEKSGYTILENEHKNRWEHIWETSDVQIEGSESAQQAIRFNIFNMMQTYTGVDSRLNIGPKGFTGEKYGGSTYWDTEAYCIPFYLSTSAEDISKNLLIYRYKQLDKAIENAEKLGFTGGAALFPMVTMNGEECHNEWEITFEEIHRNGAILYGIYTYIQKTMDKDYLAQYGLEVLIAVSRFWAQRVNYSNEKKQYVMLGVTGPNEYENNVNNNWYTNKIAQWSLKYTLESIKWVKNNHKNRYQEIISKINFTSDEVKKFTEVANNMYFPEKDGIFLQQDGFLDKDIVNVDDLKPEDRPINQNWSWDRILRSSCIKQADVLQGMYFFEDQFTTEEHLKNFKFYEPLTVHESSLSPCVHGILASKLGLADKAYEMYLRTARLDLDNYNNDTEDGCHITSMAGTWMSIVHGFGGLRYKEGEMFLSPTIPNAWDSYNFKIIDKNSPISVHVNKKHVTIDAELERDIFINNKKYTIGPKEVLKVNL
ncbi:glycoside hydrolase family 65 protein [Thiospirochaeta perfilievii]|uniref:Glycoside hydrolase family 65 protein n=1 Tax=Thiospirochaeta perfilievii TaxID=252967 RepID=A0A5C1QFM8_9SPIO|nr:family 65 glycosyl hydrolase domain-containing protein [Thiospirochaeta perfilievii]QEN05396.1 glycoside hydrolase family 65 protein [Thiospirochaeta perfilievii]